VWVERFFEWFVSDKRALHCSQHKPPCLVRIFCSSGMTATPCSLRAHRNQATERNSLQEAVQETGDSVRNLEETSHLPQRCQVRQCILSAQSTLAYILLQYMYKGEIKVEVSQEPLCSLSRPHPMCSRRRSWWLCSTLLRAWRSGASIDSSYPA